MIAWGVQLRYRKGFVAAVATALVLILPSFAGAWNYTGHRIIASIAYLRSRPALHARVLGLDENAAPAARLRQVKQTRANEPTQASIRGEGSGTVAKPVTRPTRRNPTS